MNPMTISELFNTLDMESIYRILGVLLFTSSLLYLVNDSPKKWGKVLFSGLLGGTFAFGTVLPPVVTGTCVVLMVLIVVVIGVKPDQHKLPSEERRMADAARFGRWLFSPFLILFASTLALHWACDVEILPAFGISNIIILICFMLFFRETPAALIQDGHRMFDTMGWGALLPQLLAAFGVVFEAVGMGGFILEITDSFVMIDSRLMATIVYCVITAFLSMMMGNAFPAFLVVSSGIGIPLVIRRFGADPAAAGIIAMLSGYCGTLMTPMGLNFNVLPAERLGIRNLNEVLRVQRGTALLLLLINIALMYFLAF